jgi:hypothetical protein
LYNGLKRLGLVVLKRKRPKQARRFTLAGFSLSRRSVAVSALRLLRWLSKGPPSTERSHS